MRLTLAAFVLVTLFSTALCAQEQETTYQAMILSDDVIVRSGPGRNHYPTGELRPGDRVTVHRHEPGGWLMISPPSGSIDWIAADEIEIIEQPAANRPARGAVRVKQSVVWIGSSVEENSRENWHISLSPGKSVAILGEKVFDTPKGPRRYYKIEPPAGDHRWILGQFVKRVGKGPGEADPFDTESEDRNLPSPDRRQQRQHKRAQQMLADQDDQFIDYDSENDGGLKERKLVRTDNPSQISPDAATVQTGPSQEELQDDRARISKLDARFREILRRETDQWDFEALEQDYKNLQRSAAHNAIGRQVNLRLRKVAQYKKVKAEHDEFIRLTKESDEREARILSMRSQAKPGGQNPQPQSRYSGAGIIQRSVGAPRGAPLHALVAPDGRVLAYLQSAGGINLDRYLGLAVGVNGPRTHRPEWRTDHILVDKLTQVRLKP